MYSQGDGVSCGIPACLAATHLVQGQPLPFAFTDDQVRAVREHIHLLDILHILSPENAAFRTMLRSLMWLNLGLGLDPVGIT